MSKAHRNTIFVENAEILAHEAHAAGQFVMRVQAPECAQRATPGSFAHIQCDPMLPMRRPISIQRVSRQQGWVEFLYKVVGEGTRLLATRKVGECVSTMGPIGNPFELHADRTRPLLLGGGVGIPPMVFLADYLRQVQTGFQPLLLMGSEVPFPFKTQPSQIMVPGIPEGVIAASAQMDDWNIPSRLASLQDYAGVYQGYITDLARHWLSSLDPQSLQEVELFACGPHPMLEAVAALAREFGLPAQVSLEEFMACAVGGCAGCVVEVKTPAGPAMKRVCVDGPVFDAQTVFSE